MRLFTQRDAQKSRKSGQNRNVGRRVSCPLTSPAAPSPPTPLPPKRGRGEPYLCGLLEEVWDVKRPESIPKPSLSATLAGSLRSCQERRLYGARCDVPFSQYAQQRTGWWDIDDFAGDVGV